MNIRHWNSTHNDWRRALGFYREEIHILRQRLAEIAVRNTAQEVLAQVEHYENQFMLHKEVIETLLHDVSSNTAAIGKEVVKPTGLLHQMPEKMERLNNQYITEERLVLELRHSFSRFCADWL